MSAFRKFDPRCFRENAESPGEAAKVAKPAKPPPAADPSFSNFSRFSSGNSQSAKYRTSEAATSDQASETVGWTREDWKAFFDERAAIAEFDGKLPRPQAETRAFACCVAEWLNRRRSSTRPGRCAGCGEVERPEATVLPFGIEASGHTWLHSGCWPDWHAALQAEAIAALSGVGLEIPPEFPSDFGINEA
jgi:hypothetical protein